MVLSTLVFTVNGSRDSELELDLFLIKIGCDNLIATETK
jgi:hypothetical protein